MSVTILDNPNSEYMNELPALNISLIKFLDITEEQIIDGQVSLKTILGDRYLGFREVWLEARRLKKQYSSIPAYKAKEERQGDIMYMVSAQSYSPRNGKYTPFEQSAGDDGST